MYTGKPVESGLCLTLRQCFLVAARLLYYMGIVQKLFNHLIFQYFGFYRSQLFLKIGRAHV